MKIVIAILQIVLAVLLILVVLIQQKGSGLGTSFGGDMSFYRTKRGAEKLLFYATIFISVIFILFSLVGLMV